MKNNFKILTSMNIADLISLSALIPIILSLAFVLLNKPDEAIILAAIAFFIDIADGFIARKLGIASEFGKQLDSFIDLTNYLVFSAIFILKFLNFNFPIAILTITAMFASGILRLVRFNIEGGIKIDNNTQYYKGLIVPFATLSVVFLYYLSLYVLNKFIYLTPMVMFVISLLMISDLKFKKIKITYCGFLFALILVCLATIRIASR